MRVLAGDRDQDAALVEAGGTARRCRPGGDLAFEQDALPNVLSRSNITHLRAWTAFGGCRPGPRFRQPHQIEPTEGQVRGLVAIDGQAEVKGQARAQDALKLRRRQGEAVRPRRASSAVGSAWAAVRPDRPRQPRLVDIDGQHQPHRPGPGIVDVGDEGVGRRPSCLPLQPVVEPLEQRLPHRRPAGLAGHLRHREPEPWIGFAAQAITFSAVRARSIGSGGDCPGSPACPSGGT